MRAGVRVRVKVRVGLHRRVHAREGGGQDALVRVRAAEHDRRGLHGERDQHLGHEVIDPLDGLSLIHAFHEGRLVIFDPRHVAVRQLLQGCFVRIPSGVAAEPARRQEVDDELRLAHVERIEQFGEVRLVAGEQRGLAVGQEEQPLLAAVDRLDHVEHRLRKRGDA